MIRSTSYVNKAIRTAAVLTNAYVAGTILGAESSKPTLVHEFTQMIVNVDLTLGNLTSAQLKVEFSNDDTTYEQESNSSVSGGTSTLTLNEYSMSATGNYRIPIKILDRYIKISCKGTGDVTNSSCFVDVYLGIN